MVPNIRVRKFKIDPRILKSLLLRKHFTNCNKTKEESKEGDDYDQIPSLIDTKLLNERTIQVPYSTLPSSP